MVWMDNIVNIKQYTQNQAYQNLVLGKQHSHVTLTVVNNKHTTNKRHHVNHHYKK